MVFNATFNNMSIISWRSVLFVEETEVPGWKPSTCRKSLINFITLCYIEYSLPWAGFELTKVVVIGTDCIDSCKYNNHTITTPQQPLNSCLGKIISKFDVNYYSKMDNLIIVVQFNRGGFIYYYYFLFFLFLAMNGNRIRVVFDWFSRCNSVTLTILLTFYPRKF